MGRPLITQQIFPVGPHGRVKMVLKLDRTSDRCCLRFEGNKPVVYTSFELDNRKLLRQKPHQLHKD